MVLTYLNRETEFEVSEIGLIQATLGRFLEVTIRKDKPFTLKLSHN